MRIREIINEALDTSYKWEWADTRGKFEKALSMFTAAFSSLRGFAALATGDLDKAVSQYKKAPPPSRLTAKFHDIAAIFSTGDDVIWVMFENKGNGKWSLSFDAQSNEASDFKSRYDDTGTGHAARIVTTVSEILNEFLERYKPKNVQFIAPDKKRARLYKIAIKKFQKNMQYKTTDAWDDEDRMHHFDIKRQ
jgi:tetratricopeptide (TPR) repeat protein